MKTATSIADSFGAASSTYALHCDAQVKAAQKLAANLRKIKDSIPQGRVLEVGCGTGVFTKELLTILPERDFLVTDISPAMLNACKANIDARIQFATRDAEKINEKNEYAVIVCAFAAQWFSDIEATFDRLLNALVPGGYLLFSLPTDGSFPEWKKVCSETGINYSGNDLPQASAIESYCKSKNGYQKHQMLNIPVHYSSSLYFFKALKGLGAALPVSEACKNRAPNQASLAHVIRHWDKASGDSVCVTYEVMFGVLQK